MVVVCVSRMIVAAGGPRRGGALSNLGGSVVVAAFRPMLVPERSQQHGSRPEDWQCAGNNSVQAGKHGVAGNSGGGNSVTLYVVNREVVNGMA